MIGQRPVAGTAQLPGQGFGALARGTIDDAAQPPVGRNERFDLAAGVRLRLHRQPQIRAIEGADEAARCRAEQLLQDVAARRRVGGGGECEGLQLSQSIPDPPQRQIFGPKIVPPLRDAVRLVDRQHR